MNGILKKPLRTCGRLFWLAAEFLRAGATFFALVSFGSDSALQARARWLQAGCRRVMRIFNISVSVTGPIPSEGLLVSNHLSYLDVLVLGALTPAIFVAKRDVNSWPVLGRFARMAGTLFADRERRTQVRQLTRALRDVLTQRALVVLFPEGTSSNGRTVLPFKSALLESVTDCSHAVSVGFIEYRLADGDAGEEVCYWKDMTLVPHLVNLLSKKGVSASVRLAPVRPLSVNRKELARELHSQVKALGSPGRKRLCETPALVPTAI